MPAATTHAEFAKSVYDHLSQEEQAQITDLNMFVLGAQGPDVFFFHGWMVTPWSIASKGRRMHSEKVQETLQWLRLHCATPALRSYYLGYLTHYALDSIVHPLIYYVSKKEHESTGVFEGEIHFRLEAQLDVWMLHRSGRTCADYNVFQDVAVTEKNARQLGRLYHNLFREVYSDSVSEAQIVDAVGDCARMTRYLKPSNRKFTFAKNVESLIKAPHMVSAMMLMHKEEMDPALLNHAHEPFPAGSGTCTCDLPELFHEALLKSLSLIQEQNLSSCTRDFLGQVLKESNEIDVYDRY